MKESARRHLASRCYRIQELIDEQTAKLKGIAVNDIDTLVEALSVVGIGNAACRLAAIKLNIEAIIHDLRSIPKEIGESENEPPKWGTIKAVRMASLQQVREERSLAPSEHEELEDLEDEYRGYCEATNG